MIDFEKINLGSKMAYYLQVKDSIRRKIELGDLLPGEKLPSEKKLCDHFSVSRSVIRQSLIELSQEGFVYTQHGKGTFVADRKMNLAVKYFISGFGDSLIRQGMKVRNEVLVHEVIKATEKIVENLSSVEIGDKVLYFERVRFIDEVPLVYSKTHLPIKLFPEIEKMDMTQSLYSNIKKAADIEIESGKVHFEAVSANEIESKIFNLPIGAPMLLNWARVYDKEGNQIEFTKSIFRGDLARIEADIYKGINNSF